MRRYLIIPTTISLALLLVALGFSYLSVDYISGAMAQTETTGAQTAPLSAPNLYRSPGPDNPVINLHVTAAAQLLPGEYTLVAAPTAPPLSLPTEVVACAAPAAPVVSPPPGVVAPSTEAAAPLWMRVARWLPQPLPDNYRITMWSPTDTAGHYILVSGDAPQPAGHCRVVAGEKV
jgi:hypothetical protein